MKRTISYLLYKIKAGTKLKSNSNVINIIIRTSLYPSVPPKKMIKISVIVSVTDIERRAVH